MTDVHTIRAVLSQGESTLARSVERGARLEAEVLLAHALGRTRTWLYTWPEHPLDQAMRQRFHGLLEQRLVGKPIAYLTGVREFWSLRLAVNEHTLIPRQDTETLVEWALELIAKRPAPTILDLGTGCGAIALALASERPDARILATDCDGVALATAQANARAYGFRRIRFIQGNWLCPLAAQARFDLIVCNPPYIPERDPCLLHGDLRFEPRAALCSGADGLFDLRRILRAAPRFLRRGGWFLVEHGTDQGPPVRSLFRAASLVRTTTRVDLSGHERTTGGMLA